MFRNSHGEPVGAAYSPSDFGCGCCCCWVTAPRASASSMYLMARRVKIPTSAWSPVHGPSWPQPGTKWLESANALHRPYPASHLARPTPHPAECLNCSSALIKLALVELSAGGHFLRSVQIRSNRETSGAGQSRVANILICSPERPPESRPNGPAQTRRTSGPARRRETA